MVRTTARTVPSQHACAVVLRLFGVAVLDILVSADLTVDLRDINGQSVFSKRLQPRL